MYKIVILGCENSHADEFLNLIYSGKYSEIEVIGVYSEEAEASARLSKQYGVKVMAAYDEFVGEVDGIMVTARHGKNHYKFAKPYLKSGIPMFIDKPITIEVEEAKIFMKEAEQNGVKIFGGSTCARMKEVLDLSEIRKSGELGAFMGGNLICPLHILEEYGGFYFYAQHLVQIMTSVFGTDVKEVFASGAKENISLIVRYPSFEITASYFPVDYYAVTVAGAKKSKHISFEVTSDCFQKEMDEMLRLLKGGKQLQTYDEVILPVFIMNAIEASCKSGKWAKVFKE